MQTFIRSKTCALLAACALMLISGITLAARNAETNTKVRDLLKERLATATKIHAIARVLHDGGKIRFEEVLDAQAYLLRAKLDLAQTREERIAVHEELLAVARETAKTMREQAQAGVVSTIDSLRADAGLLEVQIGLEKVKSE